MHQRLRRRLKAFGEEAALTKPDVLHKGYFLYLLLGKSHFKDLCCLEAKLFFCQWNAVFYYFIMRTNTDAAISFFDERTD